jgi:hypothetical protein
MNHSLKAERDRPPADRRRVVLSWLRRLAVVATIIIAAHLDLQTWNSFIDGIFDRADAVEPLRTFGPPIVVERDGEPTVYLITARRQLERRTRWWLRRIPAHTELQVDLWAFDGATAQPRWHRRVLAEREGSLSDMVLFGMQGQTIWLYAQGLRAFRVDDPPVQPDAVGEIQARNPALAGKLVADPRYYGLDTAGLYLTDVDARQWRIDASDFTARPVGDVPAMPRTDVVRPAPFAVATPMSFLARGMDLGGNWLGLLSSMELAKLTESPLAPDAKKGERPGAMAEYRASVNTVNYLAPLHDKQRYRLVRARVRQVSAAPRDWPKELPDNWGTRPDYSDYAILPEAPEFLGAGLLDRGSGRDPVWLLQPDSVLVLHRDKLGEDGRLQLTRVAGPAGRVVWDRALPLSLLQSSVVIGERAILFGREFQPGDPKVARDPYHDAHERLVGLDLRDGTLHTFNIGVDGPPLLEPGNVIDP